MIDSRQASVRPEGQAGLYLLFPRAKRPRAAAIRSAVAGLPHVSISHDPANEAGAPAGKAGWLELLLDGMTYDLTGLAPGEPAPLPELAYRFDCPETTLESRNPALRLAPGPHLEAGAHAVPVVRTMAALAAQLVGALPALAAVAWGPSASVMGRDYFRSTIEAWLGGGPFPALGFTAFRPTLDEGLQSVGLAFFTGQELRLEPELAADRTAATRLAVRLVNLLVGAGRIEQAEQVAAPDGSPLRLEPSANGRYVRVFAR